ncbi:uncharacterized protein L3040_009149 [Drepanopeziza brunnea f. sp. 'multigermtubi']|uniref:SRPBCC family protein n=1 Tax=Marssonina brunnea f. sp. multigermtubi (strain MB_m1) TaxID=1072389 RepID=K1WSV8_MARBU|nr:uncharacterized protein MBM_06150 [Drepanopeziza brunnea f. sp. 'multigermtubi' MB_m1]EKD15522.1 hypothetical protein MBM_06150 [Drepanopeziza brunnea f. sp. 'multigermtubi' MB_m1]KAJ5032548.1 hypothetical protein L3040_009149 [Drepanopeziza brunnea f. sp. 'multigermtubi']
MPIAIIWGCVALAFGLTALMMFIMTIISVVRDSKLFEDVIPTSTIPRESAVFTSFANEKIRGNPDEVFAAVLDFDAYPTWSPYTDYKWRETDADGLPVPGCPGTLRLTVDDSVSRTIPVRLTALDRERRIISEITTLYPKWLLVSERVQEVLPIQGESEFCEYRTYFTYQGFAAYYLLLATREEMYEIQKQCASDLRYLFEEKIRVKGLKRFRTM